MYQLKVAILEDNQIQLKNRKENLEEHKLAIVTVAEKKSDSFIEKVKALKPDAILLDIDLGSDSMTGLEVAHELKLPVLFVSGHNHKHIKEIEQLERDNDFPVKHISKPFSDKEFIKTAKDFLDEVREEITSKYITLEFASKTKSKIIVDTIVYICSDKAAGADSNNKQIFFTDRKPEILNDFSFSKMELKGFSKQKFLTAHRAIVVNAKHIKSDKRITHEIEVEVMNSKGIVETKYLKVSENFRMP